MRGRGAAERGRGRAQRLSAGSVGRPPGTTAGSRDSRPQDRSAALLFRSGAWSSEERPVRPGRDSQMIRTRGRGGEGSEGAKSQESNDPVGRGTWGRKLWRASLGERRDRSVNGLSGGAKLRSGRIGLEPVVPEGSGGCRRGACGATRASRHGDLT